MKNSITKIKSTLDAMNNRLEEAERWISDLADRVWEMIKPDRRGKITQNVNRPRKLKDTIKQNNICIIDHRR